MNSLWFVTKLYSNPLGPVIRGITQDKEGNFYFTANDSIFKIDKDTKQSEKLVTLKGWLTYILCVNDMLCIGGDSLCLYSTAERKSTILNVDRVGQITVDNENNLYCTTASNIAKVRLLDSTSPEYLFNTGYEGSEDGLLSEATVEEPQGVVWKENVLYVADTNNHLIRQIKEGVVSTISFKQHATGKKATFHRPHILGFGPDPNILFICEEDSLKIANLQNLTVKQWWHKDIPIRSLYVDSSGALYIVSDKSIYKLESLWKWKRYLWLGHLKEDSSYCHLASLPKELIKLISAWCCQEPLLF